MTKGIIFDLDGTLWDSSQSVVNSWNEVLCKYPDAVRPASTEWMHRLMGKTMTDIENIFFDYLPEERRHALMQECMEHENEYISKHGGVLFPKLSETLSLLHRDYHLSIVSNCQTGYIPAFFEAHGLGSYFDDYEEFGRTGLEKTDNIKLVVQRNKLDQAVYVGDTQGDFESTMMAGLPFIHAAYGFGTAPDYVPGIHEISELPATAEKLFSSMSRKNN